MKKLVDVERLIRWAYREELPKEQVQSFLRPAGFVGTWGAITRTGMLGTEVQEPDIRNRFGLVPDLTASTGPHIDAIYVWQSVEKLAELSLDLPDDWYPLTDMGDLGLDGHAAVGKALRKLTFRDHAGVRHLKDSPSLVVRRAAIVKPPDWTYPKPERRIECHLNGKPRWFIKETILTEQGSIEVEVDGFDNTARRPRMGAYQRTYLDPDPVEAALARAEYEIWIAALGFVCADLIGRLEDHEPVPSERPAKPWEGEGGQQADRILRDLNPPQPDVQMPSRPLAGPPPDRVPPTIKDAQKQRRKASRRGRMKEAAE